MSPAGVAQAAQLLGLTKAEVGAVATFYTMFRRRPVGKYLVSVCKTLPASCAGRGTSRPRSPSGWMPLGGTDESGMVTVEEVECLAACDGAPVVQVNTENYERLSTRRPWSCWRPCSATRSRRRRSRPTGRSPSRPRPGSTGAWPASATPARFGGTAAASGPAASANGRPAARSVGREASPPEPTEQREAGEPQPAEGAGAAAPEAPTEPEPQDPEAAHRAPGDEGPAPERGDV